MKAAATLVAGCMTGFSQATAPSKALAQEQGPAASTLTDAVAAAEEATDHAISMGSDP